MGSWIAACGIVLALFAMVFAQVRVFPCNHPKTELIIRLLNRLSPGLKSPVEFPCGCRVLGGADNG